MSVDDEITRFDWGRIRTYAGYAEMMPDAVRRLVAAPDEQEAARLGAWIERVLLSAAGPCEGCGAVAAGFPHYVAVLRRQSGPVADLFACIGLVDVLAFHDPALREEAVAAWKLVRTNGRSPDLAVAVGNTLDDLECR
ncbi:hypothetical protein ACQPZJ_24380 [Actinoplanes sp. CA-054009]